MRRTWMAALLLAATPTLLAGQGGGDDLDRAGALRRRIEERFTARVKEELGLNDAQAARLRETVGQYFLQRRGLEQDERRLRLALSGQLRPGVAADKDSVAKLTNGLVDLKIRYAQTYRDEMHDLSAFLDPVQRAQFFILRERLLERVREVLDRRGVGGPGGRGGGGGGGAAGPDSLEP